MNNTGISISQSADVKSVKTTNSEGNNALSKEEIKYYQEKIGDEYKFVSNEGMSGSYATAYKLEDKNGNQFVLKIISKKRGEMSNENSFKRTMDNIRRAGPFGFLGSSWTHFLFNDCRNTIRKTMF